MLTLILKNWKWVLVIGLLTLIFFQHAYILRQNGKIDELNGELLLTKKTLEVSQISLKEMSLQVDKQNLAISKFEEESKRMLEKHKHELERARANANKFKADAASIMNQRPTPGVSECDNANSIINQELKNARN
jgi:hypothetical protein